MENTKTTPAAVADNAAPTVPAQAGPVDADVQVTAREVAEALDPQLVARLAAQARAQGLSLLGRTGPAAHRAPADHMVTLGHQPLLGKAQRPSVHQLWTVNGLAAA